MPENDGEIKKVETKDSQREIGGDFNNKNPADAGAGLEQNPERPINILESQLTQEEKAWHDISGNITAAGQMGSRVYNKMYDRGHVNASDVVVEESAPPEALLRQIEIMQYRAADLGEARKLYTQQAVQFREKLKELSANNASGPDSLSAALSGLGLAIQNAGKTLLQEYEVLEQASLIEHAYKQMLIKSDGYDSLEDLNNQIEHIYKRRHELSQKRLGTLRHRSKIDQLDTEYKKKLKLLNSTYLPYPVNKSELKRVMKDFHEQTYQAVKMTAEACLARFNGYLESHPIGKSAKSMTEVTAVLNNVSETGREGYREILRLMPDTETAQQRFAIERSFQKIWDFLHLALEAARQNRYDNQLPKRNNFYSPETSLIRNAAKNATIDEWKAITADGRVREYAAPEQVRAWERRMGELSAMDLIASYERTEYENDHKEQCLEKMFTWGGADIASQTLVEARPGLGTYTRHYYIEKLAQFAKRIFEDDSALLKAQSPSLVRAITLIRDQPEALGKTKILNPEYAELMVQIKNDPEVARIVRQQCREYMHADQITMLCVETSGAVSGMYKDYGSGWKHILTVPELENHSNEPVYFMKGTPGFEKTLSSVIGVLYNNAVMVQEMPEPSSVTEPVRFGSYGYSGWKISVTNKETAAMAVKYGHDENLYAEAYIDNPAKEEILENINQTAINMFLQGDNGVKRYILNRIKNTRDSIDLAEICNWLESQTKEKIETKLFRSLVECAKQRALHGDKQLAWVEIKRVAAEN